MQKTQTERIHRDPDLNKKNHRVNKFESHKKTLGRPVRTSRISLNFWLVDLLWILGPVLTHSREIEKVSG